jgi:(4-(4-[2-(gamma-L-glutamylamino)ethyl]phenoxymethyl)furan-2-yl)methanamine synthase
MASMSHVVLGLDIGGANLKAATPNPNGRGVSLPFPLWKQPDRLPAALAELIAQFDGVQEFAVTMTGELCDCFDTKQAGVNAIITAVLNVSRSWPVRFWATSGKFLNSNEARVHWDDVAAANWHALATFAGGYLRQGTCVLVDVGSTTTDVIPVLDGSPWTHGKSDTDRLRNGELVYTGVKRTPLCALLPPGETCAEFFATTQDAHLLLGQIPEDPIDCDTADNRAATVRGAHARIARMIGGDATSVSETQARQLALTAAERQFELVRKAVEQQTRRVIGLQRESLGVRRWAVTSGSGEFLARRAVQSLRPNFDDVLSLSDRLGPALSECAPAFAVATLARERPL